MKEYFKTRRQLAISYEKDITKILKEQQEYWSRIMEQRIKQAKDKVYIEKQSEIAELLEDIDRKNEHIKKMRKKNIEIEKLKNELAIKCQSMDFMKKGIEEFIGQIGSRSGLIDYAVKQGEKLIKRDD